LLPDKPLFVPDLPGYGNSAAPDRHDKVSVGLVVVEALQEVVNNSTSKSAKTTPIVLVGHDRGARVAHHLHLAHRDASVLGFNIVGLALLDIVPTLSQWQIGDTAAQATGWFHWSFLANPSIAVPMIKAYGGGKWAINMIERWAGTNAEGLEKMRSGDAQAVYAEFFDRVEIIEATTRDYEAGATSDLEVEAISNKEGNGISLPLLLVYSAGFLPKRAKKPILEVWSQPWIDGPHLITDCPIGDGVGHFIPEEAPEKTVEALLGWLQTNSISE
jgi:pimeloyl-ACP methyl ester carboxylesterase